MWWIPGELYEHPVCEDFVVDLGNSRDRQLPRRRYAAVHRYGEIQRWNYGQCERSGIVANSEPGHGHREFNRPGHGNVRRFDDGVGHFERGQGVVYS